MKLQGSEVQDHETLQSQIGKIAENRLPLSGLEIFHGRLITGAVFSVGLSLAGLTAAPVVPLASDKIPATPNAVTALLRVPRFEACFVRIKVRPP